MNQSQMNREPASFGAALRDAADSFTMPHIEQLHERAVRRGRQIKRRRAAGASLSAAMAVGAVGALTASLLSSGAPAQSPTASGVGAHESVYTAVPPIHPGTARYMVEHLKAVLPPTVKLDIQIGNEKNLALSGFGYNIPASTGLWATSASAFITKAGQRYSVAVAAVRDWTSPNCTSAPLAPNASCTSKPLGRGTLVSTTTPGVTGEWLYAWSLADGESITLSVDVKDGSTNAPNPFTEQQVESLLTASAWTSVLDNLPQPVHCDGLRPLQDNNSYSGWLCPSTGKKYPGHADAYWTYS